MPKMRIQERIRKALLEAGGRMEYHALMRAVFPKAQYPRAFNYQANGGPPGCAMAFNAALNRMGCIEDRSGPGRGKVQLLYAEVLTARDEAARRSQHEKS